VPEARFCRVCGTRFNKLEQPGEGGPVSPRGQTIPLSNEGRNTKGMGEDPLAPVSNTARVKRAEMEDLLRSPRLSRAPDQESDGAKVASDRLQNSARSTAIEDIHRSAPPTNELTPPPGTPVAATPAEPSPSSRRMGRVLLVAGGLLLVLALVGGGLALFSSRRSTPSEAGSPPQPPNNDEKRSVNEQLAEAETLMASGKTSEAIALLQSVVRLDPENAEAHRRLGEALEKSGERREAIEEYRIATQNDESNQALWRALASAQFAEGLFNDAVESYRRLVALMGETGVDDQTRLDYAEALLLAGRTEEARAMYQKVSTSASQELARKAKEHLAQLPPPPGSSPAASTQPSRDSRTDLAQNGGPQTAPQPSPSASPQPSPTVQPTPAASTPATNDSAAQNDPDAYYNRGLNIISGRDLKSIPRAELLQALEYFQRAQTSSSGPHRAQASRYVEQLGREYDRRKKQP
jgi:tetratricopeptide (TPR) repeat protein